MCPIACASARLGLVTLVSACLLQAPVQAGAAKPLGVVVTAENALLGNTAAATGVDLFSGDTLVTQENGSIRASAGPSQVYLLASSSATLLQQADEVRAKLDHGTLGFSTDQPARLDIETPLGVVRGANGQPIFGQVAVLSPSRVRISSFKGSLLMKTPDGAERSIAPGETYEASLSPTTGASDAGIQGVGKGSSFDWKKLIGPAIIIGGAATAAAWIYDEQSESCSDTCCGTNPRTCND